MAFCEMCGTPIPDGTTRCANCAAPAAEAAPAAAPASPTVDLNEYVGKIKGTGINFIGIIAQIFNILMLCLPVLKGTHIWEIADMLGKYYIVAFAVIFVIIVSLAGYLLKQDKVAKVAGIVNLVALLLVWFPFGTYTLFGVTFGTFAVGFYLWLIGVVLQLASPLAMKLFNQYVK